MNEEHTKANTFNSIDCFFQKEETKFNVIQKFANKKDQKLKQEQ